MLENIQRLGQGQRLLIFILIFGGGLFILVALTILLIRGNETPQTRSQSVALVDEVTVREFATLPDDDAYPAAVLATTTGQIYTASYLTGALWQISADGQPVEVPGSRDALGTVAGLASAPDGTIYIVDQNDIDPATSGGSVKQRLPDGTFTTFVAAPDDRGFIIPQDIAVDSAGFVYISDRGRDEIWRFNPDGSGGLLWWTPPPLTEVTSYDTAGLEYDPTRDALVVTDGVNDTIYRVPLADPSQAELLYHHNGRPNTPGFNGVTVGADGAIYVAALAQAGVARLQGDTLNYIAGLFRGASDVDFAAPDRLYVTNWDQTALARPSTTPFLPFALDLITLNPPAAG